MQNLTLERIRWFVKRFPDNPISESWADMLCGDWEKGEDLDPFAHEADWYFCGGHLEMQEIGEYWAFREGLYDVRS